MMPLPTDRRAPLEAVDDAQLLAELQPTAVKLLDRHLGTAKEWFPHELVPWSRGRDYADGESWDPEAAKLHLDRLPGMVRGLRKRRSETRMRPSRASQHRSPE